METSTSIYYNRITSPHIPQQTILPPKHPLQTLPLSNNGKRSFNITIWNVPQLQGETAGLSPTFRRHQSGTTIDFIYASQFFYSHLYASAIDFMNSTWTDHALLTTHLRFHSDFHHPGLWKCHPQLANNKYFINSLYAELDNYYDTLDQSPDLPTPQDQWDRIKLLTKTIARKIGRRYRDWEHRQLKRLQRKRNKILRQYKLTQQLNARLPIVEKQISLLQQSFTETLALKAGKHWRENGEKSAGYLKRTIEMRQIKSCISELKHPDSQLPCTTTASMQDAAIAFYTNLYTPTEVSPESIDQLSNTIPLSEHVSSSHSSFLLTPFTLENLQDTAKRSPNHSSPGVDGLPYKILSVLLNHPSTGILAVQVFNDALLKCIFPPSWLTTCMSLLPKKGDLTSLSNYRPISLINTDAKSFTRLLNARLMPCFNRLISPSQLGFMPNRFIGDHGLSLNITKTIATHTSSSIALLLDQEKAYDRIHPTYLSQIMKSFGIPAPLISCITELFFSTQIHINLNGSITNTPFTQQRGLRQGDPLSPLLFNIAFDPFLRSIIQDSNFQGFDLSKEVPPTNNNAETQDPMADIYADLPHLFNPNGFPTITTDTHQTYSTNSPPIIKILAYADDTLVFVHNSQDFQLLQQHIHTYMLASNALLNYNKTTAISLSGKPHPTWQSLLTQLNITTWHDRTSPLPVTYLGYPICSSSSQRNHAFTHLYNSIQHACSIHSQRQLSIRGRATVLNSLILSKLWHVLRLASFTKTQLISLRSLGTKFINHHIFPRITFPTMCLSRKQGGLGVLDIVQQQAALQWRWLSPLFTTLSLPTTPLINPLCMPASVFFT